MIASFLKSITPQQGFGDIALRLLSFFIAIQFKNIWSVIHNEKLEPLQLSEYKVGKLNEISFPYLDFVFPGGFIFIFFCQSGKFEDD